MKIPGSLYFSMPLTRNCMAKMLFPVPAPPATRLTLFRLKPPSIIPSMPGIPVGTRLEVPLAGLFSCFFGILLDKGERDLVWINTDSAFPDGKSIDVRQVVRSEEHTSELQSQFHL